MAEQYDIQSRIVVDEKPSFQAIALIERRLLQMEKHALRLGLRMSRFLGLGFSGAARGTDMRGLMLSFDRIERRAEQAGRRMAGSLRMGMQAAGSPTGSAMGRGASAMGFGGLGRFALGAGGIFAAGRGVGGILGIHTKMQDATGAVVTAFTALSGLSRMDAMRAAGEDIQRLNAAAASGVGGLQDYVEAYRLLIGADTGRSRSELQGLTKQVLTAGFAMRGKQGLSLAPLDIVQALGQGVNDKITPIAMAAVKAAGVTSEAFNKLQRSAKVDVLMKGFAAFDQGAEVMGRTWNARMETFRDQVRQLARRLTEPLFERWSEQLEQANRWLERNKDRLGEIVDTWGPKLVTMWDKLIEKAGLYAAVVGAGMVVQHVPALSVGGRGGSLAGRLGLAAPPGFKAPGFLSVALSALRGLLGTIGRFAGPIGLVTLGFASVFGAFREWPDLLVGLKDAGMELVGALGSIGSAFGFMFEKGSLFNMVGWVIVETLTAGTRVVSFFARVIGSVVLVFGAGLRLLGNMARRAWETVRMIGSFFGLSDGDDAARRFHELEHERDALALDAAEAFQKIWEDQDKKIAEAEAALNGKSPEAEKKPPVNSGMLNITGPISIKVDTKVNQDPNSVALAVEEAFGKLIRSPTVARRVPSLARG